VSVATTSFIRVHASKRMYVLGSFHRIFSSRQEVQANANECHGRTLGIAGRNVGPMAGEPVCSMSCDSRS
jgi:hypothetical protein